MDNDLIRREDALSALRQYAEQKHAVGQTELANGILKAVNFLEKPENVPTAYDLAAVESELKEYQRNYDSGLGDFTNELCDRVLRNVISTVQNGRKRVK